LVQDASIDVFANTGDGSLRQLDVNLAVANPESDGAVDELVLSIGIADPNADQEISTPDDAAPIADLLGRLPTGIPSLGGLAPGDVATPPAPEAGATGPAPEAGATGTEAYYQCVAEAPTPEAVNQCASLLGAG